MVSVGRHAIDFVDRVGATAGEAGLAVYIADPHAATAKPALIAAGLAAAKVIYVKLQQWLAAHPDDVPAPPKTPALTGGSENRIVGGNMGVQLPPDANFVSPHLEYTPSWLESGVPSKAAQP